MSQQQAQNPKDNAGKAPTPKGNDDPKHGEITDAELETVSGGIEYGPSEDIHRPKPLGFGGDEWERKKL